MVHFFWTAVITFTEHLQCAGWVPVPQRAKRHVAFTVKWERERHESKNSIGKAEAFSPWRAYKGEMWPNWIREGLLEKMETEWTLKAAVLQMRFRTSNICTTLVLLKYRLLGVTPELLDQKLGVRPSNLCCRGILMLSLCSKVCVKSKKRKGAGERVLGKRTSLCEDSMVGKDPRSTWTRATEREPSCS